jgi:NarL family two-component system response regulator LiaR
MTGQEVQHFGEKVLIHLNEDIMCPIRHINHMSPLRLLLIDDHLMVTEALTSRLTSAGDLWVAGRCTTADPNLIDIVRGLRPDVVTIEVESLGDAAGEMLRKVIATSPEAKVVVLSADPDVRHAVDAARAGVAAWVTKDQGAAELETVLRGVVRGESWFPPRMLGEVLRELRTDVSRVRQQHGWQHLLTRRERDVLLGMMEGRASQQIAEDLDISRDTVRTHTRNLFAKLDVHSRLEAVRFGREANLRRVGPSGYPALTVLPSPQATSGRWGTP